VITATAAQVVLLPAVLRGVEAKNLNLVQTDKEAQEVIKEDSLKE
jgi:hypothetical protein